MIQTGVLLHVRHPQTMDWTNLVWGIPSEDKMGDLPKLVEIMLRKANTEPVSVVVLGTTEAAKDGLLEGAYTKKFLLDHFDQLVEFPRLKPLLEALSSEQLHAFRSQLQNIRITPIIKNTAQEIVEAAQIFAQAGVNQIVQITAVSHGPRCIQLQALARANGQIPRNQLWSVVLSDMCFSGADPLSTQVLEPPHRGDDPMIGFKPALTDALRPYHYQLSAEGKKELNNLVAEFMEKNLPES